MKVFFGVILLYYFLGVQHFLTVSTGYSEPTIAWINIAVITVIALLYYHCKTHEASRDQIKKVLLSIYTRLRAISEKYLFVLALIAFVLSTVAQFLWPEQASYAGRFFAVWLVTLCISWDAFWDARIYLGRHLFLHKESVFWISVAATFLTLYWTAACALWSPLIAIAVGMIIYVGIMKRARVIRGYNVWKLFSTRLYVVALIIAVASTAVQYSGSNTVAAIQKTLEYANITIQMYRNQTTQAIQTLTTEDVDVIVEQEETTEVWVVGEEILSGDTQEELIIATGVVEEEIIESSIDLEAQVTFTQALEHIFSTYEIPLSTKTNVRFSNVSVNNERYALFKTAHERSLLGASINPDGFVRCDVYMVMKGIVAGRSIGNQSNVFDKYRTAATANDEINGCTRNGMLKVGNL